MKLRKPFLFLLSLLTFFQVPVAQETPGALLVDRLSWSDCEATKLRLVNFALQLSPDSKGFIVIYGKKAETYRNPLFEELLTEVIDFWKIDRDRFTFVHGEDKEDFLAEFWEVPAGAEKPAYIEGNWNYAVNTKKPFMFNQDYQGMSGICEPTLRPELFSKFLSANPNLRGNIVIYETSVNKFRNAEKRLLNKLIREHKVARNRLKTFYVKDNFSGVELWLVPRKKK